MKIFNNWSVVEVNGSKQSKQIATWNLGRCGKIPVGYKSSDNLPKEI